MASASSPLVRSLIRGGKSVANIFFRARTANLTFTETVQNTGPAIRSRLRFNQTPACQYPVFSESGGGSCKKVEAAHVKRVVDSENADSEEEETDFDEEEFDDLDIEDDDKEFEDIDDDDEEEEDDKYARKKK